MLDLAVFEVGDSATTYVTNGLTHNKTKNKRADDQDLSVLRLRCIFLVNVQRMMIHRKQRKQVALCLGDCLGREVLINITDSEVLQKSAKVLFGIIHFLTLLDAFIES